MACMTPKGVATIPCCLVCCTTDFYLSQQRPLDQLSALSNSLFPANSEHGTTALTASIPSSLVSRQSRFEAPFLPIALVCSSYAVFLLSLTHLALLSSLHGWFCLVCSPTALILIDTPPVDTHQLPINDSCCIIVPEPCLNIPTPGAAI